MPPGTSDIQITIGQCVSLSGAVIVTTPHTLSLIDASKGIKMFRDLRVPILAVVSYTLNRSNQYIAYMDRLGRKYGLFYM